MAATLVVMAMTDAAPSHLPPRVLSTTTLSPRWKPAPVESSASDLMDAESRLPLLARIPRPATVDVTTAASGPYMRRLSIMGTPVKSNLRSGYQGNGILRPEYLRA